MCYQIDVFSLGGGHFKITLQDIKSNDCAVTFICYGMKCPQSVKWIDILLCLTIQDSSTDLVTNLRFHDEISPLGKICVVWIVEKRTTENTLEVEQITVVFKQTRYFPKNVTEEHLTTLVVYLYYIALCGVLATDHNIF